MGKLEGVIFDERSAREGSEEQLEDKLLVSIQQLDTVIAAEGRARVESEASMAQLLEQMCQKMHDELRREKGDRQATEAVLMKLLDDSVESIALRADEKTMTRLQQRREERVSRRKAEQEESLLRKDEWVIAFEREKAKLRDAFALEKEAADKAENAMLEHRPNV